MSTGDSVKRESSTNGEPATLDDSDSPCGAKKPTLDDGEIFELLGRDAVEREWASDPAWSAWLAHAWGDALLRLRKHGDFERFCRAALRIPRGETEQRRVDLGESEAAQRRSDEVDFRAPARVDAANATEPLAAIDSSKIPTAHLAGPVDFTELDAALLDLLPWRKGPFLFRDATHNSLTLDTEWRSNLKWDRVLELAPRFDGARVLDVGTGNGYYLLLLLEAGASLAWGIEPSVLYTSQYLAIARAFAPRGAALLPTPVEEMSAARLPAAFDVVLSMGVLYHRRDPLAHLRELLDLTRAGGQLVLETLVVDGPRGHVLTPPGRYAQMRNVFTIPSLLTLEDWLARLGCRQIRSGPVVVTSVDEQRSTRFMPHPSLDSFLEPTSDAAPVSESRGSTDVSSVGAASLAARTKPSDARRTIEGHPGPARVVVVAEIG